MHKPTELHEAKTYVIVIAKTTSNGPKTLQHLSVQAVLSYLILDTEVKQQCCAHKNFSCIFLCCSGDSCAIIDAQVLVTLPIYKYM